MYAQGRRNDHPYIRGIVYGIYAFEAVQTVLLTHDVFQQLAFSFGNYKGLIAPYLTGFELVIQPAISAHPCPASLWVVSHKLSPRPSRNRNTMLLCMAYT